MVKIANLCALYILPWWKKLEIKHKFKNKYSAMERKRRNICVNSERVDASRNFLLKERAVPVMVTSVEAK